MKKILYVTTIDLTINTFLVPHITHLIDNGYKVDCACNIQKKIDIELLNRGITIHNIKFSRNPLSIDNIKAINIIREIQNKYKYDVVHVHTPVASFITRFALRDKKIKVIYTCHGFHFYKGAPIINWLLYYPLEKIAAKWTDKIITINNEDYERAKKFNLRENGNVYLMNGVGINPDKYTVDNFNKKKYREDLGVEENDLMILILAELNKNKNHMQIINALKDMKDCSKVKVICAGKGPLEKFLKEKVKSFGLENNIKFIGFREDIKELLNSCDCVALFSKREGLGKCLLEGMISEKVLLATNTRGPKTFIKDKKNGFLVGIGDYKKIGIILETLIKDQDLIKNITKNSKEDINKYLMENVLDELIEYYK